MPLSGGAGRAPRVEGEPRVRRRPGGAALAPRARQKATRGVPGPQARRKFTRVSSDPRAKRRFTRGWLVQLFDGPPKLLGFRRSWTHVSVVIDLGYQNNNHFRIIHTLVDTS
jgi:hypothetical protein